MQRAAWLSRRPEPPSLTATQVALQFVGDIYAGGRPSIEAALDQVPPNEWAALLRSLLVAEVNARRSRGESPTAREYLPRFPAHTEIVQAVLPKARPRAAESPPLPARPANHVAARAAHVVLAEEPPVVAPNISLPRPRRRWRRWFGTAAIGIAAAAAAVPFLLPALPKHPETRTSAPPRVIEVPVPPLEPKATPKASPTDPKRDLAEWVLAVGGHGTILPNGASRRPFSAETPLPKVRFAVTAVVLPPEAAGHWKPDDLQRLRGHEKLSILELHTKTELTETALNPLAGLPLRGLELDAPVQASGQFFASFAGLESLSLPHAPDFSDADLAALSSLGKLATLAVNSPKLTFKGFEELKTPALRSLTLGPGVAVTADLVRILQRFPLEEFECAVEVTDDAFVEFALFPEVRRIRLHNARLTDSALRAVEGLGNLEEFRATGSSVTGPGLEHLAERTGLRVLDLSGAKLTSDALGPLLGLPALKELSLAGNPITDDAATILAQLDGLETLDLGETAVTDATLGGLAKHLTLKTLIVTDTRVTAAGVRDFEALTPNCKVVFGKRK